MNRATTETQTLREGDVIDWEVRDERGEPVICDLTRPEARELKRECGGRVCKVVVSH